MSKRLGKNDIIFIAVLFAASLLVIGYFYLWHGKKGSRVEIYVDGTLFGSYGLSEDARIAITDAAGNVTNTLVIENGRAKMLAADCPDKLCVYQNAISLAGENIVCLPNKVICLVADDSGDGLDAVIH